ncbi:hypothetical protein CASFOL_041449 [Castilleja foliolosa]|uniref:DUF7722 domain-containing protein n=1 Tax=Castilleja foliolosa TaxID=1961234 RepID=A0ABD3BBP0_9LAMI
MVYNWLFNTAHTLLHVEHQSLAVIGNGDRELKRGVNYGFQMPLHYPRYSRLDYEKMEEWQLDLLLQQYGLFYNGCVEEKRNFVIGTFLWPDQY